jgi:hypothetical protein
MTLRGLRFERDDLDLAAWVRLREAGAPCVLLDMSEPDAADPVIARYIAKGEEQRLHKRYLCAHREPWYSLEPVDPPDLILSPLITHTVHIVRNTLAALPSNSLYGLYANADVPEAHVEAVRDWLASRDGLCALQAHGHRLPGGSLKLEPGDLRSLPVPLTVLERDRAKAAVAGGAAL